NRHRAAGRRRLAHVRKRDRDAAALRVDQGQLVCADSDTHRFLSSLPKRRPVETHHAARPTIIAARWPPSFAAVTSARAAGAYPRENAAEMHAKCTAAAAAPTLPMQSAGC